MRGEASQGCVVAPHCHEGLSFLPCHLSAGLQGKVPKLTTSRWQPVVCVAGGRRECDVSGQGAGVRHKEPVTPFSPPLAERTFLEAPPHGLGSCPIGCPHLWGSWTPGDSPSCTPVLRPPARWCPALWGRPTVPALQPLLFPSEAFSMLSGPLFFPLLRTYHICVLVTRTET